MTCLASLYCSRDGAPREDDKSFDDNDTVATDDETLADSIVEYNDTLPSLTNTPQREGSWHRMARTTSSQREHSPRGNETLPSVLSAREDWAHRFKASLLFAVPSALYMIDNNLLYVILTYINPATQQLLWNVKIVWYVLICMACQVLTLHCVALLFSLASCTCYTTCGKTCCAGRPSLSVVFSNANLHRFNGFLSC